MLDDAVLLGGVNAATLRFRISPIGIADALLMTGRPYECAVARLSVQRVAHAIAAGARRASHQLARERGTPADRRTGRNLFGRLRGGGSPVAVRHLRLTALDRQPRLALLADNVADSTEPLALQPRDHVVGGRDVPSTGSTVAMACRHPLGTRACLRALERPPSLEGRAALREAMRSWIDPDDGDAGASHRGRHQ